MKIYLIRHSDAGSRVHSGYEDDRLRPLTEKDATSKKIASAPFGKSCKTPTDCFQPLHPREATGGALAKKLKYKQELDFSDMLAADGQRGNIIGEINENNSWANW